MSLIVLPKSRKIAKLPLCSLLMLESVMNEYDKRAGELQAMNRESESTKLDVYDISVVNRSIVCTREDMTMVVSYLSSLNQQVHSLRQVQWVLVALLAVLVLQRLFL